MYFIISAESGSYEEYIKSPVCVAKSEMEAKLALKRLQKTLEEVIVYGKTKKPRFGSNHTGVEVQIPTYWGHGRTLTFFDGSPNNDIVFVIDKVKGALEV